MKNINIFWPTVIAIALSTSLVSCHNDKMIKEYQKEQLLPKANQYSLENVFEPAKIDFDKYELEDIVTIEEYREQMQNNELSPSEKEKTR